MDLEQYGIRIERKREFPVAESEIASAILSQMEVNDCVALPSPTPYLLLRAIKREAVRTGCTIEVHEDARAIHEEARCRVWLTARGSTVPTTEDATVFIREECEIAEGVQIGKTELYRAFLKWAERRGRARLSGIMFSKAVTKAGFQLDRIRKNRLGLRLKPTPNEA